MLTGEDGLRPYARDLAGGSKGLPGSAYAAGTVPPGTGWFIGLAAADQDGQDPDGLARTWVAEMCDAMHLDGHEPVLQSLRTAGPARDGPGPRRTDRNNATPGGPSGIS